MNLSLYPPSPYLFLQPTPVILLKEGTDKSQGVPQLISNSNACQVIAEAVRTTLGPRGMDKLIVDGRGEDKGDGRGEMGRRAEGKDTKAIRTPWGLTAWMAEVSTILL